jgi:hypothetical protein
VSAIGSYCTVAAATLEVVLAVPAEFKVASAKKYKPGVRPVIV